ATPEYLTEVITLPQYVLDNGTQYWDTTITFQAQVPWNHSHRLENAVDLRTLPDLEERVLRKYEELRQFLVNCDITGYIEEDAERGIHYMERLYISDYSKIKKQIYSLTSSFIPNHPEKVIFPIQNVELALYNDGKIALLRHASLKNSALWFTDYVPEIQETLINSYFSIFLYL
uniref:hypothetical protein n=1 Tax=Marinilabilia salmonicolor TaxID=989 RepID=UPI00046A49EA